MFDDMRLFESRAFLLLLAGATCLFGWLLLPFFDVILWAVVIGVLFSPLNRTLRERFGLGGNLSALLTVLASLFTIILPLAWVLYSCAVEGVALYERIAAGSSSMAGNVYV